MTVPYPQMIRGEARGVLGEYDHKILFPEDEEFIIVYGPNGVGKTKFLEILHAVSRIDGGTLLRMPFEHAALEYSDGTTITATRTPTLFEGSDQQAYDRVIRFALYRDGQEPENWNYSGGGFEDWLVENTSWRPYDDDVWEDRVDGDLAHVAALQHRFSFAMSEQDRRRAEKRPSPVFMNFSEARPSYLIETQRLRIEAAQLPRSAARRKGEHRAGHSSRISEHAAKMRSLVNDAQTNHSTITQQLDRTFPNRVLTLSTVQKDAELVRRRYEEQNEFRSRLGRVASVELEDAVSLPPGKLEDWELRLLDLYLDDADQKLDPFRLLLQKIELLEAVVNSRLMNKRIQVTAREGLSVLHAQDGRSIDLDSLSSGEQHEIILMFDLLFNVPEGALVLIDEPEISLHVVWQLAFIPDVQRIAELAGFRFVVATHSPQIINDSWNRAVRLGPEEVPFS